MKVIDFTFYDYNMVLSGAIDFMNTTGSAGWHAVFIPEEKLEGNMTALLAHPNTRMYRADYNILYILLGQLKDGFNIDIKYPEPDLEQKFETLHIYSA